MYCLKLNTNPTLCLWHVLYLYGAAPFVFGKWRMLKRHGGMKSTEGYRGSWMCKLAVEILAKISTASLHIQDPRYPSVLFMPPWRFNIRHLPNTNGAAPYKYRTCHKQRVGLVLSFRQYIIGSILLISPLKWNQGPGALVEASNGYRPTWAKPNNQN